MNGDSPNNITDYANGNNDKQIKTNINLNQNNVSIIDNRNYPNNFINNKDINNINTDHV